MRVSSILATGAGLLLAQQAAAASQCFENWACTFHHNVANVEYSWDLHTLCREAGTEYTYVDSQNHSYSFNICGNTSTICAPNYPLYGSHGVAVQSWTDAPACPGGPTQSGCFDWDTNTPVCCTGSCAVLGTEYFRFDIVDPSNPLTGGVQLIHGGMPPDDADPYNCPINPATGLARERQLTIQLQCDPSGSATTLQVLGTSEPSTCSYVLTAKTKAACGVAGDIFDGYRDNPGHSFGFVILGSTLTIATYFALGFADARGWLDPVKRRMPACCRCGSGASSGSSGVSGSGFGSSSAYKSVGAAATPIAGNAYGTA